MLVGKHEIKRLNLNGTGKILGGKKILSDNWVCSSYGIMMEKSYQTIMCKHFKIQCITFVLQFGLKVNK